MKIKKNKAREFLDATSDEKKENETYSICRIDLGKGKTDNWHIMPFGEELVGGKPLCRQKSQSVPTIVNTLFGPADIDTIRDKVAEIQKEKEHDLCGQCVSSLYRVDTPRD